MSVSDCLFFSECMCVAVGSVMYSEHIYLSVCLSGCLSVCLCARVYCGVLCECYPFDYVRGKGRGVNGHFFLKLLKKKKRLFILLLLLLLLFVCLFVCLFFVCGFFSSVAEFSSARFGTK